ncbi:hypothetical protein NP233_g5861 [Leucocoprinus birnbaumii]|uniref:Nephrocystin 3-like N-terminal domain-containing protein n=1 Tax=Leucocoprinus birnbaumii TaxID=56174 RepID=A0AAD5VTB6_9AGAR|nr:hypothetical protein NP233_g5861 [Leucocoprinus birnbaumii]
MLEGSSDFLIQNLHQTQLTINNTSINASLGIDILYNETIHEAAYDSAYWDPPPRCRPGTRSQEIDQVSSWAISGSLTDDAPVSVLWTCGASGAGKSCLAQTSIERLKRIGGIHLVSFFFSRDHDHRKFFLTLVYQLSTQFSEYRALLNVKTLHDKSLLYHKAMASQFEELILEPLRQLQRTGKGIPARIPIFIDALDKCKSIPAQTQIIELVAAASATPDTSHFFRWAFFTRPEPHLTEAFSRLESTAICHRNVLLPLPRVGHEANAVEASIMHSRTPLPLANSFHEQQTSRSRALNASSSAAPTFLQYQSTAFSPSHPSEMSSRPCNLAQIGSSSPQSPFAHKSTNGHIYGNMPRTLPLCVEDPTPAFPPAPLLRNFPPRIAHGWSEIEPNIYTFNASKTSSVSVFVSSKSPDTSFIRMTMLAVNHISAGHTPSGIDLLYDTVAHEAAFDSNTRDPSLRYHTVVVNRYVEDINAWILSTHGDGISLVTIEDSMGIGHPAVAQKCAERLKEMNIPIATFHVEKDWDQHHKFFPTIAYQLSTEFSEYRSLLDGIIWRDKSVLQHKSMASQLRSLILNPFRELERGGRGVEQRVPILISGLEDCNDILAQREIVELVATSTSSRVRTFHWTFFNKPKTLIRNVFLDLEARSLCQTIVLPRDRIIDQAMRWNALACAQAPTSLLNPGVACYSSDRALAGVTQLPVNTSAPSPMEVDHDGTCEKFPSPPPTNHHTLVEFPFLPGMTHSQPNAVQLACQEWQQNRWSPHTSLS